MASYVYLLASSNAGPPQTDPEDETTEADITLLEWTYAIPALWLTLFDTTNVKTFMDPDDGIEIQYILTPRAEALERLQSKIVAFKAIFSNADIYCSQWLNYLRCLDCRYLKADVSEILDVRGIPGELQAALAFLTNPSLQTTTAFFSLTSLPNILNNSDIIERQESKLEYSTVQHLIGLFAE